MLSLTCLAVAEFVFGTGCLKSLELFQDCRKFGRARCVPSLSQGMGSVQTDQQIDAARQGAASVLQPRNVNGGHAESVGEEPCVHPHALPQEPHFLAHESSRLSNHNVGKQFQ